MVTLWATFAPCFLWIFAGAPYLERISAEPRLRSALAAVTAAVVGVIMNLSVWFAAHVLFERTGTFAAGPITIVAPEWASLDLASAGLAALSVLLLFMAKRGVVVTLAAAAAAGVALYASGAV